MPSNLKLVSEISEPREALSAAIQLRDAAREQVETRRATLERATGLVERLEKNLNDFDAVNERIAAARAAEFRRTLTQGIDAPMASLSKELGESGLRKLDAANQVDGARQAHSALSRELSEAEAELTLCQANVETAARVVVSQSADSLAHDLVALEAQAAIMRARLMGATMLRQGIGFRVAQSTLALLRAGPENGRVMNGSVADREFWDSFLARLTVDANATVDSE